MEINFKNKKVLITGAAGGIGSAITERVIKHGGNVVAVDTSKEHLEHLKRRISSVEIVHADLTDWDAVQKSIRPLLPIDMLVNCAGYVDVQPLGDVTQEAFQKTFDVNVKGMFAITQVIVDDLLKTNRTGSIVNISSQAAQAGLLYHTVYCASKGAVDAFTRALALELGPKGIRVNAVNPTVVMTAMGRKAWDDPVRREAIFEKIPLRRFAEVEDVVNAVIFLLSDKAAMIHGHCLPVDGGFLSA
ncbi:L-xylulose reductase-like [Cylas formicarius]|uniref:L-xylulose reductase-like n=1 Tax=Cylas formicarius TaxID=197179 RepID=UPI002958556E|nr:L-xylulose reductase-like [Cylas formicarius]